MRLTFTKRDGKYDDLTVERPDGAAETIRCPKQGIIPHDIVHFAVESTIAHRGFLGLVSRGDALAFTTAGGEAEESIERLVESFQAEMWGGRVPAEDLLASYATGCDARGHDAATVTVEDVEKIRASLDALTEQWNAVPPNESMTVEL